MCIRMYLLYSIAFGTFSVLCVLVIFGRCVILVWIRTDSKFLIASIILPCCVFVSIFVFG